jgi:hypothetical protein
MPRLARYRTFLAITLISGKGRAPPWTRKERSAAHLGRSFPIRAEVVWPARCDWSHGSSHLPYIMLDTLGRRGPYNRKERLRKPWSLFPLRRYGHIRKLGRSEELGRTFLKWHVTISGRSDHNSRPWKERPGVGMETVVGRTFPVEGYEYGPSGRSDGAHLPCQRC